MWGYGHSGAEPRRAQLAAILAADVAGYSRLTGLDEEATHAQLQDHLRSLVDPKIAEHRGRVVKNTGDGLLAEFGSVWMRCVVRWMSSEAWWSATPTVSQANRVSHRHHTIQRSSRKRHIGRVRLASQIGCDRTCYQPAGAHPGEDPSSVRR